MPQDTTTSLRGQFTSVSVGSRHICGVRKDGSVDCTTLEDPDGEFTGTLEAPDGLFSSVSVGFRHACGVRVDGSVACWDTQGQATPPEGRFRSVSGSCGVRDDGSVACWGGQAPEGAFASVSAGSRHACGVREDGSITCWDVNSADQPIPPEGAFRSVSAGTSHACGVREDGSVACWAYTYSDDGSATQPVWLFRPEGRFRSVSADYRYSCGVREDGSVACWGDDVEGSQGLAAPPEGDFTSVSTGSHYSYEYNHACGVRVDGSVACWGAARHSTRPALSITGRTSTSLTIEWLDPSGTGAFDFYQLHVSRSSEGPYSVVTSDSDERSHVHEGLEPDGVYFFVVLGCDSFVCSSETAVATTESDGPVGVPATPTGFRGKTVSGSGWFDDARLTWDAVDGATYYELWKGSYPDSSFELLAHMNSPLESQSFDIAPNYSILGLHTTSWKVRACNKAGCSPFTEVVTVD